MVHFVQVFYRTVVLDSLERLLWSVLRLAFCMREVSAAMLVVWEKCPPPCFLYGSVLVPLVSFGDELGFY